MVPVFQSLENVSGEVLSAIFVFPNFFGIVFFFLCVLFTSQLFQVSIEPVQGKKVEHTGVKIELLGQIGMAFNCVLIVNHYCLHLFIQFYSQWRFICFLAYFWILNLSIDELISNFILYIAELYFDRGNFYDFTSLGKLSI